MEHNIQSFLESGLLEEYLMGLTSESDTLKVEQYIERYPEVKEVYEKLQDDVEQFAMKYRATMPSSLKKKIMGNIEASTASKWNGLTSIMAGVAMVFLASTLFLFYQQKDLQNQYSETKEQYAELKAACEAKDKTFAELEKEHFILSHHLTEKVSLNGNGMGSGLEANAYWNKAAEASFMNIVHLPEPPEAHCFQLWADVDGEMVNMGVIKKNSEGLFTLPFKTNATSLNITVEPTGGSHHPTVSRLVASTRI